jgi:DNA polymerase-3 subunit delta
LLVTGAEEFLAEREVNAAVAAARKVEADVVRHDINLASSESTAALNEALAPTLFGGSPVVVVTGLEAAADSLPAGAADTLLAAVDSGEAALVVMVHGGGPGGAALLKAVRGRKVPEVACPKLKKAKEWDDFVVREVKNHGRSITPDGVFALRTALGDDLRGTAAAVSQLVADVSNDPMTADDLADYVGGVADVKGYAISDAVWDGRPTDVLVAVRWAFANDPNAGVGLLAAVAGGLRQLIRLAGVPRGVSDNDAAAAIGLPMPMAWKIRSLRQQLGTWRPDTLAAATTQLAALDVALKGGTDGIGLDPVQKRVALEKTLLTIARSKGAR